ncbi:bifunctional diguanylate cyclase/phosphodiesterase [Dechloromonas denitrificans]|uniref:sensor domain-containing protein n=1 Tax=Dechloromonas denitrificans TaxID=281362 RepID=UPI001CFB0703|nr:PAS domain S-box protein [Dechloromonas denitrificans]UCV08605.1 PAS domain S-box protein [Dechloromonas denitrificans]
MKDKAGRASAAGDAAHRQDTGGTDLSMPALLHELECQKRELEDKNAALRQALAEIEAAHNRYLDLYELSPVGYLTLTRDGLIAEINLTGAELFGIARDDLLDHRFAAYLATDDTERWQQLFASLILRGGQQTAEFKLQRPAAGVVYLQLDCLGVRREDERLAVHVTLTDISDKKNAEIAREESEARYRAIFDKARNGLVVADVASKRLLSANEAFLKMVGYSRDELSELAVPDIHPAAEVPQVSQAFAQLVSGEIEAAENIPVRRHDGRIIYVDINGSPFVLNGRPCILGEFHDISGRKQVEDALREQKEFFRLIAESIEGFIAVLDTEGRRIYNSPSYALLLGERNLSGTMSFLDVHPADRERVVQAFQDSVVSGVGQHLEYRFLRPDGSIRQMESHGGVIRDEQGAVKYVVVVTHDVTERKAAEEKIHHLAFYDALTQLPNRLMLNDRLQQAMAASRRSGRYGALMFLDLDDFKPVNDIHGHCVGDCLLVQAAERISRCVREIDTVARFGGDEFVVMLGELNVDLGPSMLEAGMVADKIRLAIGEPFVLDVRAKDGSLSSVELHCTVSIGVAMFLNHEFTEEEVLKLADIAMYRAKDAGRDCIRFSPAET